jgi:thiamine-monophosphate kinase
VTVSELGERRLLARIRARLERVAPPAGLVIGIGDDAAVVTPPRGARAVLTTDAQVEGVHFDRRFSSWCDVGQRALAVNLSDLAAMGAAPRWALVSLALPGSLGVLDVDELTDGLARLAGIHQVGVVGGNLTSTAGPVVVDVMAVGEAGPRDILTRAGGRPGDTLYVSGAIGGAAAGLEMLKAGRVLSEDDPGTRAAWICVDRYRRPAPRVRLGVSTGRMRAARAAIDVSDGLADAARQLAEASGCGVEIDADALPLEPGARAWWRECGHDPVTAALAGGDDYELLLAIPPAWRGRLRHLRSRVADPPLTAIGTLTKAAAGFVLIRQGRRGPLPEGFVHWAS